MFFFNLESINLTEWPTISACPSLINLFLFRETFKGLTLRKFALDVCVCMFYIYVRMDFVDLI